MKIAIIKIELEHWFDENVTDEEIHEHIENVELPKHYRINSYEFVKIIEEIK